MFSKRWAGAAVSLFLAGIAAGCVTPETESMDPPKRSITVCHGFGCLFTTPVAVTARDHKIMAGYFARATTAKAERAAISRAVQYFEKRAASVIGKRDGPRSSPREIGKAGQMDCIDESENTRALLVYLRRAGLLKHYTVESNATRGILLDSRFFHSTAVVRDKGGERWAIDSWYEATGGAPDIMPLEEWRTRGVMGQR